MKSGAPRDAAGEGARRLLRWRGDAPIVHALGLGDRPAEHRAVEFGERRRILAEHLGMGEGKAHRAVPAKRRRVPGRSGERGRAR
jgi:hypothetical protein